MGFLRMELTVVLGVMLRGTVPRNGRGENQLPKAPSQPTAVRAFLSAASCFPGRYGRKHSAKLGNVTGTDITQPGQHLLALWTSGLRTHSCPLK